MKKILLTILMAMPAIGLLAQEPVQVGKGSYAAYTPLAKSKTDEHGGDQSMYMQYRNLYIVEEAGVPIPTNDWWTDMINGDRGRSGKEVTGHLWSYPQYVQGMKYGLDIHYPKYWVDNGTEMKAQSKLMIKCGEDFNASTPLAEKWSDWTVTFSESSNTQKMTTTLAHGVPFTWTELTNIDPIITAVKTGNDGADNKLNGTVSIDFVDGTGATLTGTQTLSQFIVKISNTETADLYGVYLPAGSSVTFADGEAKIIYNGAKQFVVVALLKQNSDLITFATYAYSKPTDTKVSWNYNGSGTLTTNWKVTAEDLRTGAATTDVLQGVIPHHYRKNTNDKANGTITNLSFFGSNVYQTPRGKLKLVAGNQMDISYKFTGILPWYPVPHDFEGTDANTGHTGLGNVANAFDSEKMLTMLTNYAQKGEFGSDTYWGGKGLTQMALNMAFAREMNNEELFNTCHNRLKEALVNWLTYTPGEDNFFFAYDSRYHGLIGYNTSYDSDTYNDHHFHYGYFTLAAAMLCLVDDDFKQNYGEMVKLIVRDYNNYKRDDWACFLRMMDPWAGHCYAGGMGDGAGNGQESTSESMQGWGGMYLLGVALGDNELRDAGIFGWVSESRATAEYWFDRHGTAIDANFHTGDATDKDDFNIDYAKFTHKKDGVVDYIQPWSSNLTSHGIGWWTWFGGDPVFMQGIQWMPISPALDYLGEDKDFAEWDYQYLMRIKEHAGWDGQGGIGGATLRDSDWGNVVLSYRQWGDPDDAAAIFDEGWAEGWPTMTTSSTNGITYFVTHSHRSYGDIDWTVTANYPTARAYNKGGQKYHVAYNPTDATVTVSFSDGISMDVPARQMKCKELDYAAVTKVYPVDSSEPDMREELVMKNLALGKPCTESSHENAGTLKENATDGKTNTRWGSAHKDNEWLQVDLGENANIYKVRVLWETSYASEYRIELRDTENGAVTYSKTGTGKANEWTEINLDDQAGRYVRLVGVKRGTAYGTSLYELEVYGKLASTANTELMGVKITSDKSVLKQGVPSQLSIKGYNYNKEEMNVSPTWKTTDGTITETGLFTPANYGKVNVSATVEGMTATKTLPVEEGLRLTSLSFELDSDPVIGQAVPYTATGIDQFGAPYAGAAPTFEIFEVNGNDELAATTNASLNTEDQTFTAMVAGQYAIKMTQGTLSKTVYVRGIGPTGLRYSDIPAVEDVPSMSGKLPLFVGQEIPNMNFDYNGASLYGTDHFPVPTVGGATANALFVSQLGTFGFGALNNLDIADYNMIHADIFVVNDAPAFSFHTEGAPANKVYAKPLKAGQWNTVDLPITNTTLNWLFFSFNDYKAGDNEALVTNVYLYKETGDKIFVGSPDSKGLVTVTTFGTGINDANKAQFLNDVAALPKNATAIDLSTIALNNTTPMMISTPNNPNVIIILNGSGGDDNAASDQLAKISNTQNVVYNSGGWHLPLKATGYKVVFEDGYPVYPVNFGRCTTLTYTRTVPANSYGTICLPRDVTTLPAGLKAYELTTVTANNIEFTSVASMTAYKPYIIRNITNAAVTLTIDAQKANMELARTTADLKKSVENVDFIGNFQQFQVTGNEGYTAFRTTGQMAKLDNAGTTVGSFRAYLAGLTDSQLAHSALFDGVTGINSIGQQTDKVSDAWYDLQGRKIVKPSNGQMPKGIYIHQGKKVVVR